MQFILKLGVNFADESFYVEKREGYKEAFYVTFDALKPFQKI